MLSIINHYSQPELIASKLYDESTFYKAFIKDLEKCDKEVIIESPYITQARMKLFWPVFDKLHLKNVKIHVMTRDPREHESFMAAQSEAEIRNFEACGINTLICTGHHHRKLAILDRKIVWEGSLNILSQCWSREIMRRIQGEQMAKQMFNFLKLSKYI